MIALHVALVLRRLGAEGEAGPAPGRRPDRGVRRRPGRRHARADLRRPGGAPRDQARHRCPVRPPHRLPCGAGRHRPICRSPRRWRPSWAISLRAAAWMWRRLADYVQRCAGALDAQPAAQILGRADRVAGPCRNEPMQSSNLRSREHGRPEMTRKTGTTAAAGLGPRGPRHPRPGLSVVREATPDELASDRPRARPRRLHEPAGRLHAVADRWADATISPAACAPR